MERCPVHPESGGTVCGEFVCGTCYGERLLTDPMPRPVVMRPIDLTNGLQGRDQHYRVPGGDYRLRGRDGQLL